MPAPDKHSISPYVVGSFAADLADPQSEISLFIDEFFIEYMLSLTEKDNQDNLLDQWIVLETETEQEAFLEKLQPNFYTNFQKALHKELKEVFQQ